MDAVFQWMNATEGVMSWIASAVAIGTAVGGWMIFVKIRKLHEHPIVKPACWAIAFAITGAGLGIVVDRYVSVRAVDVAHAKNEVDSDGGADAADDSQEPHKQTPEPPVEEPPEKKSAVAPPVVKRDDTVDPATHETAKPIVKTLIVDGKTSHRNQAPSQFVASEYLGFVRCKKCGQLGSFQRVGNGPIRFVEAELAPEPIFMK